MTHRQKLFVGVTTLVFVIGVVIYGHIKMYLESEQLAQNIQMPELVVPETPMPDTLYLKISAVDHVCLALNIYHEARGESLEGQLGVAHVTMNRVAHARFPDTVCGVVYQGRHMINWKGNRVPVRHKCQFSWYCDGRSDTAYNHRGWQDSLALAERVLLGDTPDPTQGATHYYNHNIVEPAWSHQFVTTALLDNHTFQTM